MPYWLVNTRMQTDRNQLYLLLRGLKISKHRTKPERSPQEPWTVVLRAEPNGAVRTNTGPLRARTWLIGLCPVWCRSGTRTSPYDCQRAFYCPKIVESPCRKVVQAQLSATGSMAPIRVWKSSKILLARTACRWIIHRCSSFYPYGACKLLASFMWPRHLVDFVRTSSPTGTRPPVDLMWLNIN